MNVFIIIFHRDSSRIQPINELSSLPMTSLRLSRRAKLRAWAMCAATLICGERLSPEEGELGTGPAERTVSVDPLNLIQIMLAEGKR